MTQNRKRKRATQRKLKSRIRKKIIIIGVIGIAIVGVLVGAMLFTKPKDQTVIAIDAGHDKTHPGYTGLVSEYDYTSQVAKALNERLGKDKNYAVVYTHDEETDANINDRVQKIEEKKADIVISIHASADSDPNVSGVHVICEPAGYKNASQSRKLAEAIASSLQSDTTTPTLCYEYYEPLENGTYLVKYVSLDDTNQYDYETMELMEALDIPVVQVEGMYVTNQNDVDTRMSQEAIEATAEAIYQAIQTVYSK